MHILITGGTVFVSRFTAEYFAAKGHDVTVLNRGSRVQSPGVRHLCYDRHDPAIDLHDESFDAVIDVTAYTAQDVEILLNALSGTPRYILISSSAVYPEDTTLPFREDAPTGPNAHWGRYGIDKIAAEKALLSRRPDAYILRPPYLYGPGNEVYREAFVFECAEKERAFFLPGNGDMPLQFFHVRDLCRVMEAILRDPPEEHIFNVGNPEAVTIRQWAEACYAAAGRTPRFISVDASHPQRSYFPFLNYAYHLDTTRQQPLLAQVTSLAEGLAESYAWWRENRSLIRRKPLMDYIDEHLIGGPDGHA